ncbi:hypothetical protein [Alteribacter salitolerans]|nr:hypothetical protein [Alteribacter salitolerans]
MTVHIKRVEKLIEKTYDDYRHYLNEADIDNIEDKRLSSLIDNRI